MPCASAAAPRLASLVRILALGPLGMGVAGAAGLPDRGILPELASRVALAPPVRGEGSLWARLDPAHAVITLYQGDAPLKAFATTPAALTGPLARDRIDPQVLLGALAPADRAEVAGLIGGATALEVRRGPPPRTEDHDSDGIVDPLDVVLGARKLVLNGARYLDRYVALPYPGGDVPRSEGVCSDTVIRALRNAGIDLQKEVHEDLLAERAAYPMVEKVDASINHRRVKTLVRWFERHVPRMPPGTPYLPGDVVFFDTFPKRSGPDHLGVVSDRRADSGLPLVVNNWTDGAVDADLELLSWVPVTHHFRLAPRGASRK